MRRGETTPEALVKQLTKTEAQLLVSNWVLFAHDNQLPPELLGLDVDWRIWVLLGGRGGGKTRAGAEWVRHMALGLPPFTLRPARRIALIGPTLQEARSVMIEGVSGLLSVHDEVERPVYEPSKRELSWANGTVAQIYSAETPHSLRGPQFDACWCDELAKWPYARETWDMLQFAMRLGERPRQVVTTTPAPLKVVKEILARKDVHVSRLATAGNRANLAPAFIGQLLEQYGGTRLARQELDGELIDENPDSLFDFDRIAQERRATPPALTRIVVAVDPPVRSAAVNSACGIVCAGLGEDGRGYVLEDASLKNAAPLKWAGTAVAVYHRWAADRLVAEINQGGDMVETIIREVDPTVAFRPVRASRGKHLRAEPVAALYDQGRVSHVGMMRELEDEMISFEPASRGFGASPDRLDALVWALTDLMLSPVAARPRVRPL